MLVHVLAIFYLNEHLENTGLLQNYITSEGKGASIDRPGYVGCLCVTVYTHVAEICAEARFEEGPFRRRQWLPCTFDRLDIMPNFRSDLWSRAGETFWLDFFFLLFSSST